MFFFISFNLVWNIITSWIQHNEIKRLRVYVIESNSIPNKEMKFKMNISKIEDFQVNIFKISSFGLGCNIYLFNLYTQYFL